MAVQTIEVASVSEIPDDGYWGAGGLRIPYSKIGNTLHHTEHALANQ
jgi:hypothetical protein